MTPHHADVAFVLEGVAGVVDVYAIEHVERWGHIDFAVKLAPGGAAIALSHLALLRVLSREQLEAVLFFEVDLPPGLRASACRLELSTEERQAAHTRVAEKSAAHDDGTSTAPWPPREPLRKDLRALVVDSDAEVHRAMDAAIGAVRVVEQDPVAAFWKAKNEHFDVIVCDARLAFGRNGFLTQLRAIEPLVARRVVLVAHEGERELLVSSLDELGCWNSFLCRPVEPETLREILHTGAIVQRWTIPVLAARQAPLPPVLAAPRRDAVQRVVLVDDDPTSHMLFASRGTGPVQICVTSDEWEAVDLIRADDLSLVVCSVSMRTLGGTPLYRLLWNARPDIKRRFVFIARPDSIPASTAEGRAASVIGRPVTREVIDELLLARGAASRTL